MRVAAIVRGAVIGAVVSCAFSVPARAQTEKIPFHVQPYFWRSAIHTGAKGAMTQRMAESHHVKAPGAPWLRLSFPSANLGANSYLTITSLQDGATQRLDAEALAQWYNTSAYFNGEAVEVRLYLHPADEAVYFHVGDITVGDWALDPALSKSGGGQPPEIESQCGTTDDRVPSDHPATGRIVSVGCTGWIIANGKHVTAGHCIGSSAATLQFNVPPSLSNGTIQHPGPEDQYSINQSNWQFNNGGVGNDWAVFQVFNNSQTGLQPIQAQGSSFTLMQSLSPPNIRITGYGVDGGTRNQTQQTHVGPNNGSSGTTMRYRTDTEGGNSGSPVIDEATGNALGVHTHGGCTSTGGNNSGTSTFNSSFWNALNGSSGSTNLALNKPATASSTNGNNVAGRAVDGSTSTFWRSGSLGSTTVAWWRVDLQTAQNLNRVVVKWRSSYYARTYEIQVSNDASNWTSVFSTTSGNGGTDDITFTAVSARHVRVYMTLHNTSSERINEVEVYGTGGGALPRQDAEDAVTGIPADFTLLQNHPNPFNPSTNISFALPRAEHVTLKVVDLLGREVAVLVNEQRAPGVHSVTFEAGHLTSGPYFYVLQAGEARLVRKLLLAK